MRALGTVTVIAIACAGSSVASEARADDEPSPGKDMPAIPAKTIKSSDAPPDFLVETHGFLRVHYHPSAFEAVRTITAEADAARAALATTLGQSVLTHVEIRVGRTPEEMALLAPPDAPPSAHGNGAAYPSLGLMVLSVRDHEGSPSALGLVFRHQLAHLALSDATAGHPLPEWLQEGFATASSGEATLARAQILWTAHVRKSLTPFAALDTFPSEPRGARIAWAESADFVRYLERDPARFAAAIARAKSGDVLDRAITDAYGTDLRGLEQAWRDDVGTRCVTLPLAASGVVGWGVAIAAVVARRRKKKKLDVPARHDVMPEPSPTESDKSEPRLLVCDRGLGHVVYIVERKSVPAVEHEGKRHTLH
jgi:hypothetical protein